MKILLVALLFLATSLAVRGATITCANVTYAEVAAKLATCSPGDTLQIPAGTGSWGTSILTITRGITVKGAGRDSTFINTTHPAVNPPNDGCAFYITPDAAAINNEEIVRIEDLTIDGQSASRTFIYARGAWDGNVKPWRSLVIGNCRFRNQSTASGGTIYTQGQTRGVIYNNLFDKCDIILRAFGSNDTSAWLNHFQTNKAYGTADNLFFEDNQIFWSSTHNGFSPGWIETGQSGRLVGRYNTWTRANSNMFEPWDVHGFQNWEGIGLANRGNGQTGTMLVEYYGNTIIFNNSYFRFLVHRGGWGLFHNNIITGSGSLEGQINNYDLGCDARTGITGGESNNLYAWNNTVNGAEKLFTDGAQNVPNSSSGVNNICPPVENVDYWNFNASFNGSTGIGRGTAAPSGSNTAGVGYWQNASPTPTVNPSVVQAGVLWKGQGGTSWVAYYTPYTYPHPLRTAVSAAGTLSFAAVSYSVAENVGGGTVTLTVSRTGGSTGAVGCSYATSSGSATSGSDFTAASGTLSWANAESGGKTFTVTISPDATSEPDELFNAAISNETGGAVIGVPSTVGVTIVNDDGDPVPPLMGSLSFQAEDGLIESPYVNAGTSIFQSIETVVVADGGLARWRVTIPTTGDYKVEALMSATGTAANSLFINFDGEPATPTGIWDVVPLTTGSETRVANWRGAGTTESEFNPKTWNLTAGEHTLYIRGREAGVELDTISIMPAAASGGAVGGNKVGAPRNLRTVTVP